MVFCDGSCVVFVPVDVVKERLQVQRTSGATAPSTPNGGVGGGGSGDREAPMRPYRGSADTLKTILRTEGLRGIYKVRLAGVGWEKGTIYLVASDRDQGMI